MYQKRKIYTQEELKAADVEDLRVDLLCAIRDHGGDPKWASYISEAQEYLELWEVKQ